MKIFEEWLDEGTSSKQIEVPGWKKSTKAKMIKELTDKKSLYVSTWGPSDKDGEYILDAMKEEFTDSKLKKVFSVLSSTNKWRTVSGASQSKLIFRPEGRVDFNQEGDKWFYEKKFSNGTVFLFTQELIINSGMIGVICLSSTMFPIILKGKDLKKSKSLAKVSPMSLTMTSWIDLKNLLI